MITIEKSSPTSTDSQALIDQLSSELAAITGNNGKSHFDPQDVSGERAMWVIAKDENNQPIGCGAFRPLTETTAELKRMFSDRSCPGTGAALLAWLEEAARGMGYRELWLETRKINARAVQFYLKHGYVQRENYGPYIGRDEAICFAKRLTG
ncbi:GNAT family N-acetyltransferase [Enterobacter sp. MF024]|uniref:GNAT family N-acetyltransferase n=1 Tax=Enterobacter sp. MF024 TaxID=2555644 RepID=UPI001106EB08|nr:GNAT family N-acetyltransferase [Enterobacter sp. MF024]TLU65022.1 GNAT family N-acetyltransferase [Enterobacter sp. MF024]